MIASVESWDDLILTEKAFTKTQNTILDKDDPITQTIY